MSKLVISIPQTVFFFSTNNLKYEKNKGEKMEQRQEKRGEHLWPVLFVVVSTLKYNRDNHRRYMWRPWRQAQGQSAASGGTQWFYW